LTADEQNGFHHGNCAIGSAMTTFAQLLDQPRDGAHPYLTWLTAQHRAELSLASFRNGAAKAGNALIELGCEPGSRVAVYLPWHWQRAVWSAGAWLVGATIVPTGDPSSSTVVLADPETAARIDGCDVIAAVSQHPLGLAEPVPPLTEDAVTLARSQPDVFIGAPGEDHDALIIDDQVWSQAAMAEAAREAAHGARMGVYDDPFSWISTVWVPAVSDTAVVMLEKGLSDAAVAAERIG